MSFFGNSSRPDVKNGTENGGNGGSRRSEATFLGEASQILGKRDQVATPPADATPAATSMAAPAAAFGTEARPGPQAAPTPPERCTNVVAAGAKWKGTIVVEDSVRVEGNFSGEIQSKGTIHIAETAQVDAKIRAAFVVVFGTFRGEMRCDQRVELLPRSRVSGEVITKVISVHEGAILDGRVQMTTGASDSESSPRLNSRAARSMLDTSETATEPRRERATASALTSGSPAKSDE